MEIVATEDSSGGNEIQRITINRTASLEDKVWSLEVNLSEGIRIKDLVRMDEDLGKKDDWELVEVRLNKGKLYPRVKSRQPGVIGSDYEYGNQLKEDERGITPAELFSMYVDGYFEGLRGVYIPSSKKGELLFLDLLDRKLERHYFSASELPNHSIAGEYAFPTVKIPLK